MRHCILRNRIASEAKIKKLINKYKKSISVLIININRMICFKATVRIVKDFNDWYKKIEYKDLRTLIVIISSLKKWIIFQFWESLDITGKYRYSFLFFIYSGFLDMCS